MNAIRGVKYTAKILILLGVLTCAPILNAQIPAESKGNECPEIIVIGPAGVTWPGDLIRFEVSVSPEPTSGLTYNWSTNIGKVDEGQSTRSIGVRYLMEMRGTTLTATAKISGLPGNCRNSASVGVSLIWDPGAKLIAKFTVPIGSIHRQHLREAADEQKRDPDAQIIIIEYFPPGTSERSIKRKKSKIMTYMVDSLKVYGPAIVIMTAEADRPYTRIYLVPPGAIRPTP